MPWWLKICCKSLVSRLPVNYAVWQRLGVFLKSQMLDPAYAIGVFEHHFRAAEAFLAEDFSVLELGPGDSVFTAAIAWTRGAKQIYLVDVGPFIAVDMKYYGALFDLLMNPQLKAAMSVDEILRVTNASYLTEGIKSLKVIPNNSMNFIFSHSVLQNVKLAEFEQFISELYRIQAWGGVASHRIDLQDYLAHSLNSLRFSRRIWESGFSSGFYTNRLRAREIRTIFEECGYEIVSCKEEKWHKLPIRREYLHPEFRGYSTEDLLVSDLDLLVRKSQK
jgi:hypothetical protein